MDHDQIAEEQQPAPKRVVDLTADNVVIDLRDSTMEHARQPPSGATVLAPTNPGRPVSGRPCDLVSGLEFVALESGDPGWDKAEQFVYDNYRDAGYCRESPLRRVEELVQWTTGHTMYAVFDEHEAVVGTARIIKGPFDALPVGQFTRTDHDDPDSLAELSCLAVTPTARGLSVVVHLCRAVFVDAWRSGAHALCFAIDDWMVELLADSYCLPIRPIGEARRYMGGDVTPTAMTLDGANFVDTARSNPGYWQWMTEAFTPSEAGSWQLPIVLVDNPQAAEVSTSN